MLSFFGLGLGRQVFEVYGGNGTPADPYRAVCLGDANCEVRVDTTTAPPFTVIPFDVPAAPPPGFSPTGDRVRVTPNNHQFDTFPTPPTGTLDLGTNFEAITWIWGGSSALGPGAFALLYVVGDLGKPDRWFFAVPSEIKLIEKNPMFP